jgi:hypothetical protein
MTTELDVFPSGGAGWRDASRASRVISRYRTGAQIRVGAVDADTDIAAAKVDGITHATGQAMGAVVRVAQAQRQLETLAPEASGRLALLADAHVLALSDLLSDLRRDLRRK